MSRFELATRMKLRFETELVGNITTEDLWDCPLINDRGISLDKIAKTISKALKESEEESFVVKESSANNILSLKLNIVKHIIMVKLEAADALKEAAANHVKKQKIMSIMADKEDESMKGESMENLQKMLDDL